MQLLALMLMQVYARYVAAQMQRDGDVVALVPQGSFGGY
jgi:hypothetical protein